MPIIIFICSLFLSNISFACFSINKSFIESTASLEIQKYKNLMESMKSVVADYIDFRREFKSNNVPKNLRKEYGKFIIEHSLYEADSAESVLQDFKQLSKLLDLFIENRLGKYNEGAFFQSLKDLAKSQDSLDQNFVCSPSKFYKRLKENRNKYRPSPDYPFVYFDKTIFDFLDMIVTHYKNDIDRYVTQSTLQPSDIRTDIIIFSDKIFRKSGYLQLQSLMDQLYNSFAKFSRNTLPLYRFLERQALENIKEELSCEKDPQKDIKIEASKEEINTQIQKDDAKPNQEIAQEEKSQLIVEEEMGDSRWWLGYELEKKLLAQRNLSLKSAGLGEKSRILKDENEIVDAILNKYNKTKHYDLLADILRPWNGNKLKELNWRDQVVPLLKDCGASVKQKCNGSRNKVILNGNITVFHTHGTIGIDTINSHLRNYLIQSLENNLNLTY